jgi:hypothetical protein
MSLFEAHRREPQEWSETTDNIVKQLEENKAPIRRWFFRGLFALNLILASFVFWLIVVPSLL